MSSIKTIEEAHSDVCTWLINRPKGATRSSEKSGRAVLKLLRIYSDCYMKLLPSNLQDDFKIYFSKGQSNLPSVLWVALVPRLRKVYNSMSVTTCFGTKGEGSVIGIMDATTMPQFWLPRTKRDESSILVNLDAKNSKFKYNNRFHNPTEHTIDAFNEREIQKHVTSCCETLVTIVEERFCYKRTTV